MLRARLHFGGHAEHASVFQAVSIFEIVEGFVEYEIRLAFNAGQTLLQPRVQRIETLIEGLGVALIAFGVGRIGSAEVGSHFPGNDSGVDRR